MSQGLACYKCRLYVRGDWAYCERCGNEAAEDLERFKLRDEQNLKTILVRAEDLRMLESQLAALTLQFNIVNDELVKAKAEIADKTAVFLGTIAILKEIKENAQAETHRLRETIQRNEDKSVECERLKAEIDRLHANLDDVAITCALTNKRLRAALAELLTGHDNIYIAYFGPRSNPKDDIATHKARAALSEGDSHEI